MGLIHCFYEIKHFNFLVVGGILTSHVYSSQAQIIFFYSHPETYVENIFFLNRQKSHSLVG